jgi:antitoxin VapB
MIDTNDVYHFGAPRMTAPAKKAAEGGATAKLFLHGRSQAVRLPKEFRLPGTEVRVSKVGNKVILEPMEKPPFDAEAFWAKLDALGARDFLIDGLPDDPPLPPDDDISFD